MGPASNYSPPVSFFFYQPSSHVFFSLDHVTLLSRGSRLFAGPVDAIAPHLSKAGLAPCPGGTSLADHMLYLTCTAHETLAAAADDDNTDTSMCFDDFG